MITEYSGLLEDFHQQVEAYHSYAWGLLETCERLQGKEATASQVERLFQEVLRRYQPWEWEWGETKEEVGKRDGRLLCTRAVRLLHFFQREEA